MLADSVTRLARASGLVVVTGSHGGVVSASLIAGLRGLGAVFNDASRGKDDAGIAGLAFLESLGIPAVAVSHLSARIGNARETLYGLVSRTNASAREVGCGSGQRGFEATAALTRARAMDVTLPLAVESRSRIHTTAAGVAVWALDSASLVRDADADGVVVTGSHGALLGGRAEAALRWPAVAAVYNDAGGGPDGRGRSRLAALDTRGIPAATVAACSARIGDGRSTFHDGVTSAVNATAARFGARRDQPTVEFVELVTRSQKRNGSP